MESAFSLKPPRLTFSNITIFTRFNPWGHALTAVRICCCRGQSNQRKAMEPGN